MKLLERGKQDAIDLYFIPKEKLWVGYLGWSAGGDLVITLGDINGQRLTNVIGDLTPNPQNFSKKAEVDGGYIKWNESHTAFVTFMRGFEGECYSEISGYDFSSHLKFPNITLDEGLLPSSISVDNFLPWGTGQPWWNDSKIYVEITPYEIDGNNDIEMRLPQKVGIYELTPHGVKFEILKNSPTQDFYFEPLGNDVSIRARPYERKPLCGP